MENKGFTRRDVFFSALFLLWFIASVGVLVWASKNNAAWLAATAFGQCFFLTGTAGCVKFIMDGRFLKNSMLAGIPVAGLIMVAWGIDDIDGVSGIWFLPVCGISLMALGALILAGPVMDVRLRRRRCTHPVNADVAQIRTHTSERHTSSGTKRRTLYCPVYSMYYKGRDWEICDGHFDRHKTKKGELHRLLVNPENPEDFYDPEREKRINPAAAAFGLFFLAAGVTALFMALV